MRPIHHRLRLAVRWSRFVARSVARGDLDFARNALRADAALAGLTLRDVFAGVRAVECNICGWTGRRFYPNTGPGYDERDTLCPGCGCLDRHRSLIALLAQTTDFFVEQHDVIEVAPLRGLHALYLRQPSLHYRSFDLERFAMERGDLTAMRYRDGSADYFLCFHVLEHIPDEAAAVREILRVLRPGGVLVMQVPVDWSVERTYDYGKPDPREVGHVRRYGRDVAERIASYGFEVDARRVGDVIDPALVRRHGLGVEPILFVTKPV